MSRRRRGAGEGRRPGPAGPRRGPFEAAAAPDPRGQLDDRLGRRPVHHRVGQAEDHGLVEQHARRRARAIDAAYSARRHGCCPGFHPPRTAEHLPRGGRRCRPRLGQSQLGRELAVRVQVEPQVGRRQRAQQFDVLMVDPARRRQRREHRFRGQARPEPGVVHADVVRPDGVRRSVRSPVRSHPRTSPGCRAGDVGVGSPTHRRGDDARRVGQVDEDARARAPPAAPRSGPCSGSCASRWRTRLDLRLLPGDPESPPECLVEGTRVGTHTNTDQHDVAPSRARSRSVSELITMPRVSAVTRPAGIGHEGGRSADDPATRAGGSSGRRVAASGHATRASTGSEAWMSRCRR